MLDQYYRKVTLAAFFALFLLACSSSKESSENESLPKPPVAQGQKAPLATFESTFRPSEYDEDVGAGEQRLADHRTQPDSDASSDSMKVEEEILLGFRIQIFVSQSIDEANRARHSAAQLITADSLYVVYDPPVYKVRVGNYRTQSDANSALTSIVQKGYPDAWIVTDRIIQRKFVRIRRDEY